MKNFNFTVIILSLSMIGFLSCTQNKEVKNGATLTKASQETVKHRRFFSDNSFWNQPIPKDAEIDSRSDLWIEMLNSEPSKEYFGITYNKWTVPVYYANENTPLVKVNKRYLTDKQKKRWNTLNDNDTFEHGPDYSPVPIPEGAMPDPENDAHFCVVDWDRQLAWDMWGLHKLDDGTWESNTGMVFRLDGNGVFDANKLGYIDHESVHFHGPSRAAGVPVIAGLIMYDEVMEGEIKHKLSCATRFPGYKEYVYPATWTDGYIDNGIPEGAVIQLDPNLDLTPFNLTKEETVVAVALQKYGMVVVDIAGGQPIYAEGLWGYPEKTWEGKLREWDGGVNDIPFDNYRIIKVENSVFKGDGRRERAHYTNIE